MAGLAVALPFIRKRARAISPRSSPSCCSGSGQDKILFGSDYAHLDAALAGRGVLGLRAARRTSTARARGAKLTRRGQEKILGLNAARLYDIDIEAKKAGARRMPVSQSRRSDRDGAAGLSSPAAARREVWRRLDRGERPRARRACHRDGFRRAGRGRRGWRRREVRLPPSDLLVLANFAFLMLDGMRRARCWRCPGSPAVSGRAARPCSRRRSTAACAEGLAFGEIFAGLTADRRLWSDRARPSRCKAFKRRQEAVLRRAAAARPDGPAAILDMDLDGVGRRAASKLARRRGRSRDTATWPCARRLRRRAPDGPAFVTPAGRAITGRRPRRLSRRPARRVRISTEFNGALCRGLLSSALRGSGRRRRRTDARRFHHGPVPPPPRRRA